MQTLAIASHSHQVVANCCQSCSTVPRALDSELRVQVRLVFLCFVFLVGGSSKKCRNHSGILLRDNEKEIYTVYARSVQHQISQFLILKRVVIRVTQERIGRKLRLQKVVIRSRSMWPTTRGAFNLCSKHGEQCSAQFPTGRLRNAFLGQYCCSLISARHFATISHESLVVGHTHEDVGHHLS